MFANTKLKYNMSANKAGDTGSSPVSLAGR